MRHDITSALSALAPNASFAVIGDTYEGIEWSETNSQTKPTKEEVTAKINELNNSEPFKLLREERNKLISETDWTQLKDIDLNSHCEHHMVPIIGRASIGYYPDKRVVGISKLARVLDLYAKRLQTQETMTAQILNCIDKTLLPNGTAVFIDAEHHCMSTRGVLKNDVTMTTNLFSGCFLEDTNLQDRFLKMAT